MLSERTWMIITYTIIIFFIASDRLLKFLAKTNYIENGREIIGEVLTFNFIKNYNIAFSIPFSGLILNILIIFIILWLIYYFLFLIFKDKYINTVFILMIILGAASNLYDRLKYGYVIDYLDLSYFTVFNLADAMIVLGIIGLGWLLIKVDKKEKII